MELKTKIENGIKLICDPFRKKWVRATPEEVVRQRFCAYLVDEMGYPPFLIANEVTVEFNGMRQRCDSLVCKSGRYVMLIEYKAPGVNIDESVFAQAFRYNSVIDVDYIVVTNLKQCYCCRIDRDSNKAVMLRTIPRFEEIEVRG